MCSWRRRNGSCSRHSSHLRASGRRGGAQAAAKLSVSNFYDLYDAIDPAVPCSPDSSEFLPATPTSIIKHSELLNALPPAEYVPMTVSTSLSLSLCVNS